MLGLWFHLLTLSVTSELHVTMVEKDQVQPRAGSCFIMRSLDLLSEGATAELNSETLCFRVVALAGP